MGTPTTKMNLTKPTIGGDTNWGTLVNNNYDIIDNLAGYNTVSVSASGSLSVGNGPTLVKATGGVGGITLTLPDASTAANAGRVFIIVKVDAAAGAITVNTTGGQTINGAATASVPNQWDRLTVQGDGANWIVIDPVSVSGTFVSLAPAADQTITGNYKLTLDTGVLVLGTPTSIDSSAHFASENTMQVGTYDWAAYDIHTGQRYLMAIGDQSSWTNPATISFQQDVFVSSEIDLDASYTGNPAVASGLSVAFTGKGVGDWGGMWAGNFQTQFLGTGVNDYMHSLELGNNINVTLTTPRTTNEIGMISAGSNSISNGAAQLLTVTKSFVLNSAGQDYTFLNPANAVVTNNYGINLGVFKGATAENIAINIADMSGLGANDYAIKVAGGKSHFTGVSIGVRTVNTATYTVTPDDYVILADCATNTTNIAITMPDPAVVKTAQASSLFLIRRVDSSIVTYTVTINPHAAETFDGQTTILLPNQWDSVLLQSDGTNWHVLEYKFTALQNTGTFPQTVTDFAYGRGFIYDGCSMAVEYTNNPIYVQATPESALSNMVGLYVDAPTNTTGYTGNPPGGSGPSGICGIFIGDQGNLGVAPGGGSNPYGAAGILIDPQTNSSYAMITRGGRVWHQGDIYLSGHLNAGNTTPAANGDIAGVVTVSNPATTATVTFTTAFTSAPVVVITPTADPTALGAYWVTTTTNGFTVHVTTTPGTTFDFNYMVMGNPN